MRVQKLAATFVASNWRLISVLNIAFFSTALGTSIVGSCLLPERFFSGEEIFVVPQFLYGNLLVMFLFIFSFNLVISAFVVVTLPGFVFFPLSGLLLLFRSVLWGLMLHQFPMNLFLIALPTIALEGEAYIFASTVGMTVGYSWLRPKVGSRRDAFVNTLRSDSGAFVFVISLLCAAALVESVTLILL